MSDSDSVYCQSDLDYHNSDNQTDDDVMTLDDANSDNEKQFDGYDGCSSTFCCYAISHERSNDSRKGLLKLSNLSSN